MRHILFVITSFRHGGTNKSLESLLSLLDKSKYRIDVFALEHFGPYEKMLRNCRILKQDKYLHALTSQYIDTSGIIKLRSSTLKLLRNLSGIFKINLAEYLYRKAVKQIVKRNTYDTVIAYSEGAPTAFSKYFNNTNKIAWVHCDYKSYMQLNNNPNEKKLYQLYDAIVCVSEYTKESFCRVIPSVCNKVHSIHNVLSVNEIDELSTLTQTDIISKNGTFNILSIGRIDPVKRFDKIPQIARELLDRGCNFKWYLIGPKGQPKVHRLFEENIAKYRVEENLFWLGQKDNPYPYIKVSDLLVNVSVSEACPYVINEAKILHIPVVCTNFGSANEFVVDGINGYISPIEKIADKIELLFNNKKEYRKIKENIENFKYENDALIQKIENLL